MKKIGIAPFWFLATITILTVSIIIINVLIGMTIPFSVNFLILFIGALLCFVIWHAILTKGLKTSIVLFSLSFLIAFTAEALGVNFGLIFGRYHYTSILGPQLFGVPFLAALAWEPIIYAAFSITDILSPSAIDHNISWTKRLPSNICLAIIGSLATTAWDMMIDPIAVSENWWVWHGGGSYMPYIANGVPIQNFLGWLSVSFTIILIYRFIVEKSTNPIYSHALTIYGPLTLYASLFLSSFGVAVTVIGRPEAGLVGLLAMGPFISIAASNAALMTNGSVNRINLSIVETEIKS